MTTSNTGNNWASIVTNISTRKTEPKRITMEEYENWQKNALFDGLRGIRFGQSFCHSFDIQDNILFFTLNHVDADEYIRKLYIA